MKHWLLRRASVLAYPSLDEGFGFPIVEAQLAGTPVVASDVGAVSPRSAATACCWSPAATRLRSPARSPGSSTTACCVSGWSRPATATCAGSPGTHRRRDGRPVPQRQSRAAREPPARSPCWPAASARHGSCAGCSPSSPASSHRRREHRRRHRAPRAVDLTRPRHDHVHARRGDRPGARLGVGRRDVAGDGGARPVRRGAARRVGAGADVVQPRRPRPRDPLLPHRAARRGRHADRGHRRDRHARGVCGCACCR